MLLDATVALVEISKEVACRKAASVGEVGSLRALGGCTNLVKEHLQLHRPFCLGKQRFYA